MKKVTKMLPISSANSTVVLLDRHHAEVADPPSAGSSVLGYTNR